jgi:hypothetical protein
VAASAFAFLAESAIASDSTTVTAVLVTLVAEAVAALDAPDAAKVFAVAISESATGADAQNRQAVFSGTVAELATAADSLSVIRTANVPVTGVQLVISVGGVLVWAVINDSQTPNWTNIPS